METSSSATFVGPKPRSWSVVRGPRARVWISILAGTLAVGSLAVLYFRPRSTGDPQAMARVDRSESREGEPAAKRGGPGEDAIHLSEEQQRAIGLRTARVASGDSPRVTAAPGRVAPNENEYAFITPRAAGVVRSVTAHIGQEVKAGDLLATIDSPVVGEARLDLYTLQQSLEIARSQAAWEETVYVNTLELLARLRKEETPQQVHDALQDKAVGQNREKLMTAYAEYRLARATIERNRSLFEQKLITTKDFGRVQASYEVAQSTYQSLMEEMGYQVKLENTRAQQALRQAETAVRAAQERLRILGVKPDGTEPPVEGGKVIGVEPDGTLAPGAAPASRPGSVPPGAILEAGRVPAIAPLRPVGSRPEARSSPREAPVSTYSIWAPFDGTILDREMIVPGVAVDTTHRIFTMANLATVWIEASVHEGDFDMLDLIRSRGGKLHFRSPAYPDRVFDAEVSYTGDLVEEKSRSVKLLARAENPDRLLRPGMFVEVEVLSPRIKPVLRVPTSALFLDGSRTFVYLRTGPDRFERREVEAEDPRGDTAMIRGGLTEGDEVVVEGGFKLKALSRGLTIAGD